MSQATPLGNFLHATHGQLTDEDVFWHNRRRKLRQRETTEVEERCVIKMGDVVTKANAILQQHKLYMTYTKFVLSALLMYHQMKGMS